MAEIPHIFLPNRPLNNTLYDNSHSYGLKPNKKHLEDLAPYSPPGIKLKILEG